MDGVKVFVLRLPVLSDGSVKKLSGLPFCTKHQKKLSLLLGISIRLAPNIFVL